MKKFIFFAVLLLLFVFALFQFDMQAVLESLKQTSIGTLAILVLLQIISLYLINIQWHQIVKSRNADISFRDMFYINCQGNVVEAVVPGAKIGGNAARAVQIHRMGNCPGEQAASFVLVQKLFSLSAFFLLSLFAVYYIIGQASFLQARSLQILLYGIIILCLLLFSGIFIFPQQIKGYLKKKEKFRFKWLAKVVGFLLTILEQVIYFHKNLNLCIKLLFLSAVIWLIYPLKMYLLIMHVFPGVNVIYISAITFFSYTVSIIPIFPGGLGGFEGTMIALLLAIGILAGDALAVTILFRLITFWFVTLFSFLYVLFYRIKYTGGDSVQKEGPVKI